MKKPVIIEEYNPEWPRLFKAIREMYMSRIGNVIKDVHHVGSTSIPGLAAKPIIDIDIVMDSETVSPFPSIVESLDAMGYDYEGNLGIPGREAFRRRDAFVPYTEPRCEWLEHHVYVCSEESEELKRHLLFRNSLLDIGKAKVSDNNPFTLPAAFASKTFES